MIAKVIVHAPTRREAANRLARVLETTEIQGLRTNRDFLVATLRTPEFLAGDTTTDFIERVEPARIRKVSRQELIEAAIAVAMESQAQRRAKTRVLKSLPSGWRNSTMPMESINFNYADEEVEVAYRLHRDGRFRLLCDDEEHIIHAYECGDGAVDLDDNGRRLQFSVQSHGDDWLVHSASGDLVLQQQPRFPDTSLDANTGGLIAPMPGSVLATEVAAGASVSKGDLLLIMEAMKMEHRITAPRDGMVETVHVAVGDQVDNGQLLVSMAEE
jgi:propionyl-CoA carboxylase alpha chain